jgi:hypothetical protein
MSFVHRRSLKILDEAERNFHGQLVHTSFTIVEPVTAAINIECFFSHFDPSLIFAGKA